MQVHLKKYWPLFILLLLVSGCKKKVYFLPGTLETGGIAKQCSQLPELSSMLELKDEINRLVSQSLETEDPEELQRIEISLNEKIEQVRKQLTPEYTKDQYPVNYRFKVQKQFLTKNSKLGLVDFSIVGYPLFSNEIIAVEHSDTVDIILHRNASLLEICSLSGTAQGLYQVGVQGLEPDFYYRLFINDKN